MQNGRRTGNGEQANMERNKIGLPETVPAPCEDEKVSIGSAFLVGMMDFPGFFRLLL